MATNYGTYGGLLQTAYGQLGREGDQAGIDTWTNQINNWARAGQSGDWINKTVMDSFRNSAEGQAYANRAQPAQAPAATAPQAAAPAATPGQYTAANTNYKPWLGVDNPTNRWADVNGLNVPIFGKDDFKWTANDKYDANLKPGELEAFWRENGDSGQQQDWRVNPNSVKGKWDWSDTGLARLKAGGWDPNNNRNIIFGGSRDWQGEFTQGGHIGGDPNLASETDTPWEQVGNAVYKNSASTALQFKYDKYGVPHAAQGGNWITNNGEMNRKAAIAIGSIAAGAALAPAAGAVAAGEAGAATAGATATELTAAQQAAQYAQYASQAGKVMNIAGQATGNEALAKAGTYTGLASGLAGGTAGLSDASTWQNYLSSGMKLYNAGQGINNMVNPNDPTGGGYKTPLAPQTGTSDPRFRIQNTAMPDQDTNMRPTGSTGQTDVPWWQQAIGMGTNIGTSIYDANQNKDFSNNMKQFYQDALNRQAPYRDLLAQSYSNPDSFYKSNEYKGLADVYQNSVDRGAARGGTLANPTAREVLLQAHAMKAMGDYRSGITNQLNALSPDRYLEAWAKGTEAERMAAMPVGNAIRGAGGQAGQAGQVGEIIKGLIGSGASPGFIQEMIKKFGSMFPSGGGGFNPNVGGSDVGATPGYGTGGVNPEENYPTDGGQNPTVTAGDPSIVEMQPGQDGDGQWGYGGGSEPIYGDNYDYNSGGFGGGVSGGDQFDYSNYGEYAGMDMYGASGFDDMGEWF